MITPTLSHGIIHRLYGVICASCSGGVVVKPDIFAKDGAKAELRQAGWGTRKGVWFCAGCLDRKTGRDASPNGDREING